MSYVIIGFAVLAFFHFVYESILAPSWRLSIRYKLFALRDELRMLKIEHGELLDDKHFHYLQDSINATIFVLPKIEVVTVAHIKEEIEKDAHLKQRLANRQKILDDCAIKEVIEIRKKTVHLAIESLAANCGGWMIYIIPFMGLVSVYKSVERRTKALISMSERDLRHIAPDIRLQEEGIFAL